MQIDEFDIFCRISDNQSFFKSFLEKKVFLLRKMKEKRKNYFTKLYLKTNFFTDIFQRFEYKFQKTYFPKQLFFSGCFCILKKVVFYLFLLMKFHQPFGFIFFKCSQNEQATLNQKTLNQNL